MALALELVNSYTLKLNYGASIILANTTNPGWIKFKAILPNKSYAGIGFGSSMNNVNMLLFMTGDSGDKSGQVMNCDSFGM